MAQDTIVFSARKIVTMNPSRPVATHVAVRDGRIVAVGSLDEIASLGGGKVDDRFKDKVLLPGFVEGHSHIMEGMMWLLPYVGAFDRRSPDGKLVAGVASIDAIVERLQQAEKTMADPDAPLFAWGFDPLHIGSVSLTRQDLDRVSTTRPIMVVHASFHISNVNTLVLQRAELDRTTNISGVVMGKDGEPSGEVQGIAARFRVFRVLGSNPLSGNLTIEDVNRYASSCCVQGVTTVTDLHNDLAEQTVEVYRAASIVAAYHAAGIQMHIHTNGDEATEVAIEAVEAAQIATPKPDHRHTLQHCQMADAAQFKRMKALGICVNLFANHVYYWGDSHYDLTMGPERASRLDATGTALRAGVPFTIHSDAPVTPLSPLFTAWCAVNRVTSSGRVLGKDAEALTVQQALNAITIDAAYTLKLDHLVGSIETGKYADFVVLDADPLDVAPETIKDINIWGTVVGGTIREAPRA
ncbi:MAG: amidohydrolase [Bradyrhizobiaceae bacterium]|nr:MAG: amidohydrolase [Bradyrhizobiaceae bacterium]